MTRSVLGFVTAMMLVACATDDRLPTPPGLVRPSGPGPTRAAGVQATPMPAAPRESTVVDRDAALWLDNRGGSAISVRIGNADVATVACNGGARLIAGEGNVPPLPWDLAIVRVRDETTLFARHVTELPKWYVQFGDEPLGLSDGVVLGPVGPTCPPSG